jgi:hypothetical protein
MKVFSLLLFLALTPYTHAQSQEPRSLDAALVEQKVQAWLDGLSKGAVRGQLAKEEWLTQKERVEKLGYKFSPKRRAATYWSCHGGPSEFCRFEFRIGTNTKDLEASERIDAHERSVSLVLRGYAHVEGKGKNFEIAGIEEVAIQWHGKGKSEEGGKSSAGGE